MHVLESNMSNWPVQAADISDLTVLTHSAMVQCVLHRTGLQSSAKGPLFVHSMSCKSEHGTMG